jgi:hypothetical protein
MVENVSTRTDRVVHGDEEVLECEDQENQGGELQVEK